MEDSSKQGKYADILQSMEKIRKNLAEAQSALARQSQRQKDQNSLRIAKMNSKRSYRIAKTKKAHDSFDSKKISEGTNVSSNKEKNQFIMVSNKNAISLINKSIAEKELEERIKMQEYLILKKQVLKKEIELKQIKQYLNKNRQLYDHCDWVNIYGDESEVAKQGYGMYAVAHLGRKLLPLSQDPKSSHLNTEICFDHKTYIRSSHGILTNKEVNSLGQEYCHFYTSRGTCPRRNCTFKHSSDHLALCKSYLYHQCPFTETSCKLSHTITEENIPTCLFFMKGYCKNGSYCRFSHVRTNKKAKICRPFAIGGWCDRGLLCSYKHIYYCPDFVDYDNCKHGRNCNLAHPKKKIYVEVSEENNVMTGGSNRKVDQKMQEKESKDFCKNDEEKFGHISKRIFDRIAAIKTDSKDLRKLADEKSDNAYREGAEFENFVNSREKKRENDGNVEVSEVNEDINSIQKDLIENQDFIAF